MYALVPGCSGAVPESGVLPRPPFRSSANLQRSGCGVHICLSHGLFTQPKANIVIFIMRFSASARSRILPKAAQSRREGVCVYVCVCVSRRCRDENFRLGIPARHHGPLWAPDPFPDRDARTSKIEFNEMRLPRAPLPTPRTASTWIPVPTTDARLLGNGVISRV